MHHLHSNHDNQIPLSIHVEDAVQRHLNALENHDVTNLYEFFLHEFEKPLLSTILKHTHGNQSKTAQILGLNRGTLRTKLKAHGLLK